MRPMRLLVTGGAGMLGQAVAAAATRLGHDVVALSRAELDITDADHVRRVVAAAEPRAVVNCAAWTDVDGAETAEATATAVNGDGAGNVARAAAEVGARIVHVSTDYVFDGTKREPWVESDAVEPDRRLRALEARRRGAGGRRDRRARDRAHRLAVRRRRAQLRRHDARRSATSATR